jgi:hypothetical protein
MMWDYFYNTLESLKTSAERFVICSVIFLDSYVNFVLASIRERRFSVMMWFFYIDSWSNLYLRFRRAYLSF